MPLSVVPMTWKAAVAFVRLHHRHHTPSRGCKFALGCREGERLCGVAVCGRPVARALDDGLTLEVTRLATDGTRNACSFLLGRVRRVASAMGYARVVTYTLASESGSSLRAAGYRLVGERGARQWSCPSRPRDEKRVEQRLLWEA